MGSLLGPLGGQVAHTALDGEVHLDGHAIGVERHQVLVGVDDLDVSGLHDVCRGDGPAPFLTSLSWSGMGRRSS